LPGAVQYSAEFSGFVVYHTPSKQILTTSAEPSIGLGNIVGTTANFTPVNFADYSDTFTGESTALASFDGIGDFVGDDFSRNIVINGTPIGTNDYTLEFYGIFNAPTAPASAGRFSVVLGWGRFEAVGAGGGTSYTRQVGIYGQHNRLSLGVRRLDYSSENLSSVFPYSATFSNDIVESTTPGTAENFRHYCIQRINGIEYFYREGVLEHTVDNRPEGTRDVGPDATIRLFARGEPNGIGGLGQVRFTRWTARYPQAGFTPPTAPFFAPPE
jgi:hypothetical protein